MNSSGRTFDVAVVGNGALGLSLGIALCRRRVRVCVIGPAGRPGSASAAAGAMLGCFGEVTATTKGSQPQALRLDLALKARSMWDDWIGGLEHSGEDMWVARGTIIFLNAIGLPSIDEANFAAIRASLVERNEPFEDLDRFDDPWFNPEPAARSMKGIYLPHEHAIDAEVLLDRLQRTFLATGGVLLTGSASRVVAERDEIRGIELTSGEVVVAQDTVLATGARVQSLLDTLPDIVDRIPPICSGKGVSVVLQTSGVLRPRSVYRTPNRAFSCGLHALPRRSAEVYIGATNTIELEAAELPSVCDISILLRNAVRQLRRDLTFSGVRRVYAGNRPISADGFPLLGKCSVRGLWLMTGTYRDGLTISPLLASELSRLILGEAPGESLSCFTPERTPIQTSTREEIVTAAAAQMIASAYEQEWSAPVELPGLIERHLKQKYSEFAEALNDRFTPPPEMLVKACSTPRLRERFDRYYKAST